MTSRSPRRRTRVWAFGVFAVAAAAVCVRLGIWQLGRLAERRARNAVVATQGQRPPLAMEALRADGWRDSATVHWRRVRVEGVPQYGRELRHAARTQNGSPGVHLLTPLVPLGAGWGDTVLLLLRGFVHSPDGRTVALERSREGDTLRLETLVTRFPPPRPGPVTLASSPGVVTALDPDSVARLVGRPVVPLVLLVLGDTLPHPTIAIRRVPPPAPTDGPHLSYAMQWFSFAVVFVVGFVVFGVRGRARP